MEASGRVGVPTARAHLGVLARRVAPALALDLAAADAFAERGAELHPGAHAALAAVAAHARRARARGVDATLTASALRVALDADEPGLDAPAPPRASELVVAAFGVPLVVARARFVALPGPDADAPASAALGALAASYLARIRAYELESVADVDPEGVHQLRVGVRRLRAVLRLMDRLRPDAANAGAIATLRALGRAAGAVRDADVVPPLLRALAPDDPGLEPALARIAARRAAAHARLVALIGSERYVAGVARAQLAFAAVAAGDEPTTMGEAARGYVQRELRRLARRLDEDLTVAGAYHDVRRQLRRVRDAVEVLAPALRKEQRRWRARGAPVQALLGRLNDIDTALAIVPAGPRYAALRDALARRRWETLAELATPLSLLAVALHARV